MMIIFNFKKAAIVASMLLISACGAKEDLSLPPEPMGNFLLGHNVVVADQAVLGPLSRKAEPEDWKVSLTEAIAARLGRYDGEAYFHLGTHIDAYVLAIPGVPIVASPKSVLIISVNVWNDATGEKLTDEPKQFTVLERIDGATVMGSGLTQNKAQQMENLSKNAARLINKWLLVNKEWFGDAVIPEETEEVTATAEEDISE